MFDWIMKVSVHWLKDKTWNSLIMVDSEGVMEQGIIREAKSSV